MRIAIPRIRLGRFSFGGGSDSASGQSEKAGKESASDSPEPSAVAAGSILRGYGPLAAFALLFVLMAGFVPTVDVTPASTESGGEFTQPEDYVDPTQSTTPGVSPDGGTEVAADTPTNGAVGKPTGKSAGAAPALPGRGAGSCAGKPSQVPGDPYAPPCIEYTSTDNGGATANGVSKDTVTVSFRVIDEKGFLQTLATLAGADIVDTPADIQRTIVAFEQFFNDHYQFYGRKIKIVFHKGSGSITTELVGGGRDAAVADAVTIKEEINPFIEMNSASEPFADAIADQKIIGFGSPYLSRKWHNDRRPYAWSLATDGSIVSEVAAEFANKMLVKRPAAFAGDALKNNTRVLAGLAPENPWYQESVDNAQTVLQSEGNDFGDNRIKYKLDINSMSNQAAGVISQLKGKNPQVTTVLCGCDPIFPVFLSAKAAEQDYEPEWIVVGTALTDWDVAAQLYNQEQWQHAFGVSSLGEPRPIRAGLGYSAYKSVRDDEPAFAVELIYGTMLMIASGIQMAGHNLTPLSFEAGLKTWPGGTGPYGTMGFGPVDYTPTRDYRIIWWSTDAISIVNSSQGAYKVSYGGERYAPGKFPRLPADQQPAVFTG